MQRLLKAIHSALPFKQGIFTAVRAITPVPERIYKHLHFHGIFRVKVSDTEHFKIHHHGTIIENELFWRGIRGWERVSLELWTRLSRRSSVIFDIGANTGVYSLVSSAVNRNATIVAVEPMDRLFAKLVGNLRLNNAQVKALSCAISDRDGNAIIYQDPANAHMLDASINPDHDPDNRSLRPLEITVRTVASVVRELGLERVDLLKIDVETHEPEVLDGAIEILRRDRPTMLIEILNEGVAARVAQLVDGLDYSFYNIDEVTWPPRQVAALSKSAHFNFLICQPEVANSIGLWTEAY